MSAGHGKVDVRHRLLQDDFGHFRVILADGSHQAGHAHQLGVGHAYQLGVGDLTQIGVGVLAQLGVGELT